MDDNIAADQVAQCICVGVPLCSSTPRPGSIQAGNFSGRHLMLKQAWMNIVPCNTHHDKHSGDLPQHHCLAESGTKLQAGHQCA